MLSRRFCGGVPFLKLINEHLVLDKDVVLKCGRDAQMWRAMGAQEPVCAHGRHRAEPRGALHLTPFYDARFRL